MTQGFPNLQEPVWREGLTGVGQSWSGLLGWGSCTVSHAVGVQSKSQISLGYVLLQLGQPPWTCLALRSWLGTCMEPLMPLEEYKMALIKAHQRKYSLVIFIAGLEDFN